MYRFAILLFISTATPSIANDVTFNRDVRPILADKCFHCHGPDAAERQAELRLDQEESAKVDRDGYPVIKSGDVEHSELAVRILSEDPDLQMPPPNSGRILTDTEKQTLLNWIEAGADWEGHWSFIPPTRPELPTIQKNGWPRNAIDHFVLHRLEEAGLKPSPETERETWIRRVSLDLTGLPPTLQEVDEFLADESANGEEKVVDRLLASSRYGEHMAAAWLDAARYADTDGYQNDGPRTMFRYRDWVINAFNDNMPFDRFTIEQLAGDLLPNATLSQKIATGFNRNHRYNSEAGLVLEEFLLENAVDRVDTTSTVWMGLTLGCARCHDHKYDPFSQREYYQLISFFDNITESGRAIKFGNSEPWIVAPTDSQQTQLQELDGQIAARERELGEARAALNLGSTIAYLRDVDIANFDPDATTLVATGLTHHFRFEDMEAEGISVETGGPVLRDGLYGKSATVGGNGILELGKVGDIACQTRASISFWMKPEELKSGVIMSRQSSGSTRPGFTVELRDGHLQFHIIARWIAGVGAVETHETLKANEWVHVTLTNDGSQRALGQQIWLNGKLTATDVLYNTNSNTGGTAKNSVLRIGGGVHGDKFKGQVDELRFYNRTLFDDEIRLLAERATMSEIVASDPEGMTRRMKDKLFAWTCAAFGGNSHKGIGNPDILKAAAAQNEWLSLRRKRVKLVDSFPTTMVMEERDAPGSTTIRVRGIYNNHGDAVVSDTPDVFPSMPDGDEPVRLRFARWLVNGQHPLTARVTVNRFWQQLFGTGLVKTPEDFGLQGELPSHPELLDWLAVEFVESDWNVKALQKLIVLSATYRQSSRHSPSNAGRSLTLQSRAHPAATTKPPLAFRTKSTRVSNSSAADSSTGSTLESQAMTVDPANRLLWRGPRLRLTARQLRDQALFVSGLMTPDIGGPSVSPYQPAKLWAEMSNMKYKQSKGSDLYRRGLYTIWKRTVAPPSLAILDAADRENCSVRPKRTNTPLQALTLLNETTFVEAARHLAVRMQKEGGDDPLGFAFRTVTSRQITEQQRELLAGARATYFGEFSAAPDEAAKLLSVGESPVPQDINPVELAADTMVCNVLLNLDEVVTKE